MANNQMKRSFSHHGKANHTCKSYQREGQRVGRKESRKKEKEGGKKEKGVLEKIWRN